MINTDSLKKLIDKKIELYQTIPDLLDKMEFYEIDVGDNPKDAENEIQSLKLKKEAIYIISAKIHNNSVLDYVEIKKEFSSLKEQHTNGSYNISKINKNHFNPKNEMTLYVGSKRESVSTRLRQHLGLIDKNNRSVYSLYLNDWWNSRGDITIKILYCESSISNEQLQIIEDLYWDDLKPFFGKKGGNSTSEN